MVFLPQEVVLSWRGRLALLEQKGAAAEHRAYKGDHRENDWVPRNVMVADNESGKEEDENNGACAELVGMEGTHAADGEVVVVPFCGHMELQENHGEGEEDPSSHWNVEVGPALVPQVAVDDRTNNHVEEAGRWRSLLEASCPCLGGDEKEGVHGNHDNCLHKVVFLEADDSRKVMANHKESILLDEAAEDRHVANPYDCFRTTCLKCCNQRRCQLMELCFCCNASGTKNPKPTVVPVFQILRLCLDFRQFNANCLQQNQWHDQFKSTQLSNKGSFEILNTRRHHQLTRTVLPSFLFLWALYRLFLGDCYHFQPASLVSRKHLDGNTK